MSKLRFNGGIPTEPDVALLMEAYKVPEPGTLIEYSAAESIIGQKRSACRFRSVTTAWRKKLLKDHNVIMGAVKNVGFKSLEPNERSGFIGGKYKTGIRFVRKSQILAVRSDVTKMSPEARRVVEHVQHTAAALVLADATAAKALPPIK